MASCSISSDRIAFEFANAFIVRLVSVTSLMLGPIPPSIFQVMYAATPILVHTPARARKSHGTKKPAPYRGKARASFFPYWL